MPLYTELSWVNPTLSNDGPTRYLSLSEVAALTGRHPELLRQWCATGRLPCERIGGSWILDERHLAIVQAAPTRGQRRRSEMSDPSVLVAAAFLDADRGRLAHGALRDRYGLAPPDTGVADLALDSVAMVLVAARVPAATAGDVVAMFKTLGGQIVANAVDRYSGRPVATLATAPHDSP